MFNIFVINLLKLNYITNKIIKTKNTHKNYKQSYD